MRPSEGDKSGPAAANPPTRASGRPNRGCKTGLVVGFAAAGILVVLYAARTQPVLAIPLSAQLGLLQLLPTSYWLGMALLGLSVVLAARGESDLLFVFAGATLVAAMAGTPILFEPNPPVWDAYLHFSGAEFVARTGHLPTSPNEYAANWPGLFLVLAFTDLLGSLAPLQFIALFPFFSGIITFAGLFLFLRSFFSPSLARTASILAILLAVWAQYWLSPQGVGLALALLVLATAWDRRVPMRVANALLFFALVVSHATSAIFLLAFLGFDALLLSVLPVSPRTAAARGTARKYSPFPAYATVWLGWLFYMASGSAETTKVAIVTQIGSLLQVGAKTGTVVAQRTSGNIFLWAPRLRLASLGLFGLFVVVGLIAAFLRRESRGRARFLLASVAGLSVLALADILFFHAQLYDRALMFFAIFAPGICLFGIGQLGVKPRTRHVVVAVLLVASLTAASTLYYQEAYNFVPNQVMSAAQFYSSGGANPLVIGEILPTPVWQMQQAPAPWKSLLFGEATPITPAFLNRSSAVFAGFDPTTELWYELGYGIGPYQYYVSQQDNYSLVYDNGFVQAYLLHSPPGPG